MQIHEESSFDNTNAFHQLMKHFDFVNEHYRSSWHSPFFFRPKNELYLWSDLHIRITQIRYRFTPTTHGELYYEWYIEIGVFDGPVTYNRFVTSNEYIPPIRNFLRPYAFSFEQKDTNWPIILYHLEMLHLETRDARLQIYKRQQTYIILILSKKCMLPRELVLMICEKIHNINPINYYLI